MQEIQAVGSMESLQEYLEIRPQATADILRFLRHLLEIMQHQEITRDLLMTEAQYFLGKYLSPDVRDFIAKRVFAFYRKNAMNILEQNLAYFPYSTQGIDSHTILRLLEFTAWSQEEIDNLKQNTTIKYSEPVQNIEVKDTVEKNIEQSIESHNDSAKNKNESLIEEKASQTENEEKCQEDVIFDTPEKKEKKRLSLEEIEAKIHSENEEDHHPDFLTPMTEQEDLDQVTQQQKEELEKQLESMKQVNITPINIKAYEDWIIPRLHDLAPWHLPKILNGILDRYLHSTEQKYPLMRLKDNLARQEKYVTTPLAIQVYINYGTKIYQEILDTYSQLSNLPELNDIIRQYLEKAIEIAIKEHAEELRKTIEYCQTPIDLKRLLANYPLYDNSLLQLYSQLRIIEKIKVVLTAHTEDSENLLKIMNQTLGQNEANLQRSLQTILCQNETQYKIYDHLTEVYDINSLFRYLQVMKKEETMSSIAETIFQLITTFLRSKKISYTTFKTSINFLYPGLQQKITYVIKKKLRQDMQHDIDKIFNSKSSIETIWKEWNAFLQNPQWEDSGLEIFNMPFATFQQKFHIATQTKEPHITLKRVFAHNNNIPESLYTMVQNYHLQEKQSEQKTLTNSYKALLELSEDYKNKQILSLKRPLISHFQSFGILNYSKTDQPLTGYDIARIISKTKNLSEIAFPVNLHDSFTQLLKAMLE